MKKRCLSFALALLFVLCLCFGAQAEVLTPDDLLSKKLDNFVNSYLSSWGMSLAFGAVDSSVAETLSFQESFDKVWSQQNPRIITDLKESDVAFDGDRSSFTSLYGEARRPGVHIKVAGREWGDMLAMSYSWHYTWVELKELLGEEVTVMPEASRLFEALTVVFNTDTGSPCTVVGSGGLVDAAAAAGKRALVLSEDSRGVSITLNVCLTNIWNRTANQGPQFVGDLLLVPDGMADTYLVGTMWIVEKKAGSSGTASSGSGGGGCSAGFGTLGLTAGVFLCLRQWNRRSFSK